MGTLNISQGTTLDFVSVILWHAKYKGSVNVMSVCAQTWLHIISGTACLAIWVINSPLITVGTEAAVMHGSVPWLREGWSLWTPGGALHPWGFHFCVSSCFFDRDYRGRQGYFHLNLFLARWKYIHVFLKDEAFSARGAWWWTCPVSFPERVSLTEESRFLCSVTFHLGIQRALFITPFRKYTHTKSIMFFLA